MKLTFLENFFLASQTASIRKEICGIRQHTGETLHEYWERGPSQTRMVNEIDAASNQRLENQLTELTSLVRQLAIGQHQPTMAAKSDQTENVGAIGGFQYGKQPYQNRPFDNQQQGRQPFRPGPNQGPYATQQFGSTPNTYQRQAGYQQPTPQYQAPPFQQQQQQQRVPTQGNSPSLEDLMK
ncbi:hypothetical protein CR513_36296, partial [Mucuna pruriens]